MLIWGDETTPTLRGNRIHSGDQAGIYMYDRSGGTIELNEVYGNSGANVLITEGASPALIENMIRDGQDAGALTHLLTYLLAHSPTHPLTHSLTHSRTTCAGVLVHKEGRGVLHSNNIHSNRTYGVAVLAGGSPLLRGNWLHGARQVRSPAISRDLARSPASAPGGTAQPP